MPPLHGQLSCAREARPCWFCTLSANNHGCDARSQWWPKITAHPKLEYSQWLWFSCSLNNTLQHRRQLLRSSGTQMASVNWPNTDSHKLLDVVFNNEKQLFSHAVLHFSTDLLQFHAHFSTLNLVSLHFTLNSRLLSSLNREMFHRHIHPETIGWSNSTPTEVLDCKQGTTWQQGRPGRGMDRGEKERSGKKGRACTHRKLIMASRGLCFTVTKLTAFK